MKVPSKVQSGIQLLEENSENNKKASEEALFYMAERQGFEPWVSCNTPLFESGQFNHSCISPGYLFYQM
jgi:hypothetical protein